ncbi:MAG: response regulator [Hellea sp.]
MSPEDIFAAQMWPWPEPALKRDAMGRVLFVNAAFLQMYGGQIDDWRGNIVTGWPAPQPPGMPYRFETRLPSDAGEQVYDWMEFTLADGNAFAVARNVTYLFQTPDPDPGVAEQPPFTPEQSVTPVTETLSDMIPAGQRHSDPLPAFAEQTAPEPVLQVPAVQPPVAEPAFQAPALENFVAESRETVSDITAEVAADPVFDAASYSNLADPEPAPAPAADQTAAYDAPALQAAPFEDPAPEERVVERVPEERAFERRALPLENEDAVLGNNWRDAVIAKAVGADMPKDEEPQDTAAAAPASPEGDGGPIRILLAEDNAINALLTRTLLEAEGHTVDTVEDGVLAVEAMKSSKYDLIFMDMRMPNMDGLEATRKIRAMDNVSKGLPIIALTANAFDDDRNACFDSGMNDFMTKPVSAEELSEMVRTWTKNKAERDAA